MSLKKDFEERGLIPELEQELIPEDLQDESIDSLEEKV